MGEEKGPMGDKGDTLGWTQTREMRYGVEEWRKGGPFTRIKRRTDIGPDCLGGQEYSISRLYETHQVCRLT